MNKGLIIYFILIFLLAFTIGFSVGAYWLMSWWIDIGLDILNKGGVAIEFDKDIIQKIIWAYKETAKTRLGL